MSKKVEFNFNFHIPYVLENYKIFDIGKNKNSNYIDIKKTASNLNLFSNIAYLETNKTLYNLIKIHKKKFKFSITISGVSIEIMKKYNPKLLESFKKLIKTGQVELRSSFYYDLHSPISSKKEMLNQIEKHKKIVQETFNISPTGFSNISNIFNNFPITCDNFIQKFKNEENLKLNFNYDDFGIKFDKNSGIFNFLKHLPSSFLKNNFKFNLEKNSNTPILKELQIKNEMQSSFVSHILNLESLINENDESLNHLRHISTHNNLSSLDLDGFKNNFKNNFLNYDNNYDMYINLRNIIEDLHFKIKNSKQNISQTFSNNLNEDNLKILN